MLDAASIYAVLRKVRLYVFGGLTMVFGRDKRWESKRVDSQTVRVMRTVTVKRLIFVRHGESEWNLIFNTGSKALMPFKLVAALLRELRFFFACDDGSVLFDSPLTTEGLEQAQEIATTLWAGPSDARRGREISLR